MVESFRTFPFSRGGNAAQMPLPTGTVTMTDLTDQPRFGLKGAGSADWLARQGIPLPAVNRIGIYRGMCVLRLGIDDIVVLGEDSAEEMSILVAAWNSEVGPRGYWSWREEGWAWMRLSAPAALEVMACLCAIDLRPGRFGDDEIAQTRVGRVEAVTFRRGDGFDVLFDITVSAFFVHAVTTAVKQHRAGLALNED